MRIPTFQDITQLAAEAPTRVSSSAHAVVTWIQTHPQLFTLVATLALIPALFWLWLFVRKGAMDRIHRRFMVMTFFFGMLSVPIVFSIHLTFERLFGLNIQHLFHGVADETLRRALYFIVVVGMIEEYAKHVIVKEIDYRRTFFNRVVDGIEFAVAAALGFAFVENIIYFVEAWHTVSRGAFAGVVLVRSMGSMLAHVLFSGIFGYYYGRAKFLDDRASTVGRSQHFRMHLLDGVRTHLSRIKHTFQSTPFLLHTAHVIRREELIGEGLFVAMMLHGFYDLFLDMGRVYLIVPLLFLQFLFIWHEMEVTENFSVHDLKVAAARNRAHRALSRTSS